MAFKDLRDWLDTLEAEGNLKRVKTKVDWNEEISEIVRQVSAQRGPSLLFDNIKDHENTWCKKLHVGSLARRKDIALMMGLPQDTPYSELIQVTKKRFGEAVKPVRVDTGPVKENIVRGKDVDLFQLPVPRWHPLDGGRYINTFCSAVTKDPETGECNIGMYRGMISGKAKIGTMLVPGQHWGIHYTKYQRIGKAMPVAFVYGWDPALSFVAAAPISNTGGNDYDVVGAIRQQPVELVKCETSDLEVPASAEIVIEGTISTDSGTYEIEGPFGEFSGYYGEPRMRPVVNIDCISFRNEPIYRGMLEGLKAGVSNETAVITYVGISAVMWNIIESQGVPGVLDMVPAPWALVKIRKTYQGQPRHVASALWGSRVAVNHFKVVMVVEEDVDIYNLRAVQLAFMYNVDPKKDLVVFPMRMGGAVDFSIPPEYRDEIKYGVGMQDKLLIDATVDWETHPIREDWWPEARRVPPRCTESVPEMKQLVQSRWQEYGF